MFSSRNRIDVCRDKSCRVCYFKKYDNNKIKSMDGFLPDRKQGCMAKNFSSETRKDFEVHLIQNVK